MNREQARLELARVLVSGVAVRQWITKEMFIDWRFDVWTGTIERQADGEVGFSPVVVRPVGVLANKLALCLCELGDAVEVYCPTCGEATTPLGKSDNPDYCCAPCATRNAALAELAAAEDRAGR